MMDTVGSAARRVLGSRGRVVTLLVLLVAVAVLTVLTVRGLRSTTSQPATGGGHGAVSGPVSSPATRVVTPTANPLLAPPDLSKFPEVDTPLLKAPFDLQDAWSRYGVTLIPSRHIFDSIPKAPPIRNLTNGAVSDAMAQAWLEANYRTNAYIGWLEAHDQIGLHAHLEAPGFLNGAIADALRAGQTVTDPPCDLYPIKVALVPVDASIEALFSERGSRTGNPYALVATFSGPCVATSSTGRVVSSTPPTGLTGIGSGSVRHDALLGDIWFADAGAPCPASGLPACRATQENS